MRQSYPGIENMPPVAINIPARKVSPSNDPEMSPTGSPGRDGLSGQPIKEGTLYITQNMGSRRVRVPVILKVYTTNFGRYAVVGQNKVVCRDCGYINLKNCNIKSVDNNSLDDSNNTDSGSSNRMLSPLRKTNSQPYSFVITPTKSEGQSFTFSVSSKTELEQWLSVLIDPDYIKESAINVTVGFPIRTPLGKLNSHRISSPRPMKKQPMMPALVEE